MRILSYLMMTCLVLATLSGCGIVDNSQLVDRLGAGEYEGFEIPGLDNTTKYDYFIADEDDWWGEYPGLNVSSNFEEPRYVFNPIVSFTIPIGMRYRISARVYPVETASQDVIWSSSDPSVATICENGIVVAISEGVAILTATTPEGDSSGITEVVVENNFHVTMHS